MADETAVLVNISEMIDLAIGTPEMGVVDFNMLQTVLHCLAQQLRILGKNVELRGSVATLPVGRENIQTIAITEFIMDTDAGQPGQEQGMKKAEVPPPQEQEPETILVVERVKKAESITRTRSPTRDVSPPSKTVPAPPPAHGISSSEKLSLVTISKFNVLETTVEDLRNRVYGSIPKNEDILEEVRSQTNLKAITDMWTSLNVSSRLEAAEAGIAKLSSLVQDLISETSDLAIELKRKSSATGLTTVSKIPPSTVQQPAPQVVPPPAAPPQVTTAPPAPSGPPAASKEELKAIQMHLERLRGDVDQLTSLFYKTVEEIQNELNAPVLEIPPPPPVVSVVVPAAAAPSAVLAPRQPRESFSQMTAGLTERINDIEKRMQVCCDTINKTEGVMQDEINSFQDQLEYLLKQVTYLTEELSSGKLSPDLIKDLQGLMELFKTVQDMKQQLSQVHDTALQLAAEKEDRHMHMNALLEQIELLKTIKLDREDMVEAMAEKADLRMLARKVSHDQFEIACDDLSKGLEHALGKLTMQESLWQQALDDIQREIEMKLDKIELSPVKDFFNHKLRQLQENLKQMASLRREAEAAGTKRKLLRDLNCISCDAQASMAMEAEASIPMSKPLPASLSMKPYLSYELDAIRKTQASHMPQRNMHDWENIDKQMSHPKQPQKVRSETNKHICNRYCGGSHTVTTPAQRVARLGHFIKQWGPDVLPLSSGLAAGDDGKMYKVSPAEGVSVGPGGAVDKPCTPKLPMRKSEPPRVQKTAVMTPECRCLEGDQPARC